MRKGKGKGKGRKGVQCTRGSGSSAESIKFMSLAYQQRLKRLLLDGEKALDIVHSEPDGYYIYLQEAIGEELGVPYVPVSLVADKPAVYSAFAEASQTLASGLLGTIMASLIDTESGVATGLAEMLPALVNKGDITVVRPADSQLTCEHMICGQLVSLEFRAAVFYLLRGMALRGEGDLLLNHIQYSTFVLVTDITATILDSGISYAGSFANLWLNVGLNDCYIADRELEPARLHSATFNLDGVEYTYRRKVGY